VGGGLDGDHGVVEKARTTRGLRPKSGGALPFQSLLWRFPWLRTTLLLTPPLGWFIVVYLASLGLLLITAFWAIDEFTTKIVQVWNLDNFQTILTDPTYQLIIGRTLIIAALVTVTDGVLAFPFAYYMARVASRRTQTLLFAAVLLPLWASYLARVYAWILILNHDGILNWSFTSIGLPAPNIGYTNTAMWLVFSYIWLPFMIVPVYGALERVPSSLLEAAADLGATRWRTLRDVMLPLALPGVVAGSIFTFSLTLGDYITPTLIGGAGSSFLGNVIFNNIGVANNIPFAAALSIVPIAIMAVYLFIAAKLGAFQAL
jgi:putative spermidine/putrescine transport system permease protein